MPPIQPGRYFVTLYNPSSSPQTYFVIANISLGQAVPVDFGASGPTNLLDDAVTYSSVFVTNTLPIASISVGLRVDHPRISDLVFHLVSPDGTRFLLMENRGGTSTNGAGVTIFTTNIVNVASSGGAGANTNYVNVGQNSGTLTINYNFYTVSDQMTVYASTNPADFSISSPTLIYNSGVINGTGMLNLPFTTTSGYLTIIMNQFSTNAAGSDQWTYSAGGVQTNYYYLTLTDDTNLTTTPIKFAPPPFVPFGYFSTNFTLSDFESATPGDYVAPATVNGWNVISNQVTVVHDPTNAYQGGNFVTLASGAISNNVATVPGAAYTLSYAYRGPGIAAFWRGENNLLDSAGTNNGSLAVGSITYTNGEVGKGLNFNGGTNRIIVPDAPQLNFGANQDFSIDAWIQPDVSSTEFDFMSILDKRIAAGLGDNPNGYEFGLASGQIHWRFMSTGFGPYGPDMRDGKFHYVALSLSRNSTTGGKLYVDGQLVGTFDPTPYNGSLVNNQPLRIGNHAAPTFNGFYKGVIDEVSLYNRALSASEIKAIYTDGSAGKFDPNASVPQSLAKAQFSVGGSNFVALANGVISKNVATVPGAQYTLSYAYRGPGIVGFWRGESNALDGVNNINGTWSGTPAYALGKVGSGFVFNGFSGDGVTFGNSSSLQLQDFTIETWLKRGSTSVATSNGSGGAGALFSCGAGGYCLYMVSNGQLQFDKLGDVLPQTGPSITDTQFHHVALTKVGGKIIFYLDGTAYPVSGSYANTFIFTTSIGIGYRPDNQDNSFLGTLDEVSFYQRALSASEIKAIYNDGTAGKFDPAATTPTSLAKANFGVSGITPNIFFGANTNWQTQTVSFTATQSATPVVVTGLEPGMLLDSFAVAGAGGGGNLYYQPEQSLDPLIGTSAYGTWQLEIQDDRVGATNHAVLDSWQLQFVFANTNPVPANVNDGVTNFIPPGGLAWIQVDVPTNADFATNILIFASGPLNMYFSTNSPPTTVNPPGDVQFLFGQTNGSVTLGTNGYPFNTTSAYIIPGGTYYIGLQNTNSFTAQYGFRVDFHLLLPNVTNAFAFTEPATLITGNSAQLNGMATPNGLPSAAWFQWGTSQVYSNTTPPVNVGNGFNVVFVSTNITGLATNIAFHYRLVVSNLVGVVYGFDQIFDQGNLVTWGADFKGQTTPVPAGLTNLVVGVGAGYDYSLALNYNGTVVAWGDNSQGQTNVPAGLTNAVAVAGGVVDSLALRSDRTVLVWGSNLYGQTNVPSDLTNAIAAVSGSYHCLALRDNGNPVAWGSDTSFQTNIPAGLSNVVAVAAGEFHSLALKNNGTVIAWGNNAEGETNVPPSLTNVVAIAAGYSHNLALKSDGTVVAWGFNGNGQTNVPSSLTNVMAIAAGGYHCLALRTDGSVVFWGDSGAGQTNFYPANLTNVFTIVGGGFHTVTVSALYGLNVTNTPPYWTNALDSTTITMNVLTTKVINNAALDSNAPPQIVFYSFVNPPSFASINAFSGVITLSPLATDGPSTNIITTVATDNGFPPLSATNRFTLIVTSTNTPPQTNTVPIYGILHTNIGGINGFLLTWFAPSNDLFQVQWTTSLAPSSWAPFTNIVSYNTNFPASSASAQFNFFDDGSQTGGFSPTRFYRLILLGSGSSSNTPPVLPTQTTRTINPLNQLVVTNTATDSNIPAQTLTYILTSTVTGTNAPAINSTNGIIIWTPDVSQAGTSNLITTIVTDNGAPPLSATNLFSVVVNPVPGISSVTYSNGGFLLTWFAPTNDIFQVQVATNLASPIVWLTFSNFITYMGSVTSTNGLFNFYDNGSQYAFSSVRFYRLQLVGIVAPVANTVSITSIISTNGVFHLTWLAPTNDQFNVRWTTNLVTWTPFLGSPITSTNGIFSFTDTNAPLLFKFYELMLLP